ncbi:MAG: hypothetical protein E7052_10300 [Lentisphaerae bacterium]|nr:hypothetical protein [Lentisphaerota bacterium]
MLCEICHKNEATIHIQEIIGGQKKSMHLCSSCAAAKQQGEGLDFGPFNLAGLLYKLSGNVSENDLPGEDAGSQLSCPVCSWDASQLQSCGRVGCSNCYKVFGSSLDDVLKNIHRGTSHVGKQPSGKGTELCSCRRKLAQLQKELQRAIETEAYEKAAELRDQISELKAQCDAAAGHTQEDAQ